MNLKDKKTTAQILAELDTEKLRKQPTTGVLPPPTLPPYGAKESPWQVEATRSWAKRGWESDQVTVHGCDRADAQVKRVIMDFGVRAKIVLMNSTLGNTEWLGYLIGQQDTDGCWHVTDIVVPKQTVAYASVEDVEPIARQAEVIGTVHSHHTMGASPSGTDKIHLVVNHPVTIITSNAGWKTSIRSELPCGAFITQDTTVTILYPDISGELQRFLDESLPNLTRWTHRTPAASPIVPGASRNYGDGWYDGV